MTVLTPVAVDASSGVVQVDLALPLGQLVDIGPLGVRCLVRLGIEPLGYVDIRGPRRLPTDAWAAAIWATLGDTIAAKGGAQGIDPPGKPTGAGIGRSDFAEASTVAPSLTVVIATHDRPAALDRCLTSLTAARPAPAAVIVVDNAPSSDGTLAVVTRWAADDATISYVLEPRAGLGRAHNAALPHITTERVAFTDDDVTVDRHWVGALDRAFAATADTVCVTGLIAPAELIAHEQWWVELGSGFAKGFDRRVRSLRTSTEEGSLFPFDAGTLGSGANMAFATSYLRECGGFDATLGTGTRSMGGDDLAALHAVITSGRDLVYAPDAIVFHRHHANRPALERQAMGYGAGLTAYLTSTMIHRPAVAFELARRVVPGLRHVFAKNSALNDRRPADYPAALVWRERAGMATGPVRYAWQRHLDRRDAERAA